jgi:hypothetical protein
MLLRLLAIAALAAVTLSVAFSMWRGGTFRDWLRTTPDKPPEIVFDNGSVRDLPLPPASAPSKGITLSPPGALRKCVRGEQVTYSNLTCPPGFREREIAKDRVTVIPGVRTPQSTAVQSAAKPHEAMKDALDLKRDEKLRQRMIDKAVEAEAR